MPYRKCYGIAIKIWRVRPKSPVCLHNTELIHDPFSQMVQPGTPPWKWLLAPQT